MSQQQHVIATEHDAEQGSTYSSYIVGFVLSAFLTLVAYVLVTRHLLSGVAALIGLGGLAFVQFAVQLVCFLHLGRETKPRWKQMVFWFMILTVIIVVGGSIWIMENLNYNMMHGVELKNYMHTNEGI